MSKIIWSLCFLIVVGAILDTSKSFANLTTFVLFLLLNETTMSYFFHYGLLLLLFDKLDTVPSKLLMKLHDCSSNNP